MNYCTYCKKPLDEQARGLVCSRCWFAFVRTFKPSKEMTQVIQGNPPWFLPDEKAQKQNVGQIALFDKE